MLFEINCSAGDHLILKQSSTSSAFPCLSAAPSHSSPPPAFSALPTGKSSGIALATMSLLAFMPFALAWRIVAAGIEPFVADPSSIALEEGTLDIPPTFYRTASIFSSSTSYSYWSPEVGRTTASRQYLPRCAIPD